MSPSGTPPHVVRRQSPGIDPATSSLLSDCRPTHRRSVDVAAPVCRLFCWFSVHAVKGQGALCVPHYGCVVGALFPHLLLFHSHFGHINAPRLTVIGKHRDHCEKKEAARQTPLWRTQRAWMYAGRGSPSQYREAAAGGRAVQPRPAGRCDTEAALPGGRGTRHSQRVEVMLGSREALRWPIQSV